MDGQDCPACFLSLVIPAYNESAGIAHALAEADAALADLGLRYEIIVVDDGSRDDTARQVEQAIAQHPSARLVRHGTNRGYGAALRTGFEAARGERIAFTDADCQFFLADLKPLIQLSETHDVAVGWRRDRQDAALRKFYSRGYNLLVRTLLGATVRDVDCALKVFRREALARILPESRGFFVNTEMLTRARQLHLRIAETGVRHRPRLRGASTVSLLDIPRTLNALLPFWWSTVLFSGALSREVNPAGEPVGEPRDSLRSSRGLAAVFGLLVLAALLFYGRLGAPLLEPEEARYAEIPRQMLAQGRLIEPVLHGEDYYHKPPLLYWLVMFCYAVFGVHDWAARLVPATAGVLTVLLTYAWGARTVGRRAGLLAAVMLALSAKFLYQAGMLTFDSLTALWVLGSLASLHFSVFTTTSSGGRGRHAFADPTRGQQAVRDHDESMPVAGRFMLSRWWSRLQGHREGPAKAWRPASPAIRRGWLVMAGLACGLGILTKGPVALALVVPPVLAWQFLERRMPRLRLRDWSLFLGAAAIVATPWFAAVLWRDPQALAEFLWTHNLMRYVAPLDHEEPVWFYVLPVLVGMLPWSLAAIPLVRQLARRWSRAGRRRPPALGFFLLALCWCFAFFSLSGCKRQGYILPVFPLLALVLGTYVSNALPWPVSLARLRVHPRWNLAGHRATLTTLALAIAVGVAAGLRGIWAPALVASWSIGCGAGLLVLWWRGPSKIAWRSGALCGATMFALLFTAVHELLPSYHRLFALRGQVRRHRDLADDRGVAVASYPKRWDSVSFYLMRDDVTVYTPERRGALIDDVRARGRTLLFVKQGPALADLLASLPPDLEFIPRGRAGTVLAPGLVQKRDAPLRPGLKNRAGIGPAPGHPSDRVTSARSLEPGRSVSSR